MQIIQKQVGIEEVISRLPALFPYVEYTDLGTPSIFEGVDGEDGCYGHIIPPIQLPYNAGLRIDGEDLLLGGEVYSYKTIMYYYYRYKDNLKNYYDILGVKYNKDSEDGQASEIYTAYMEHKRLHTIYQHRKDYLTNVEKDKENIAFSEIEEAYRVLTSDEKEEYDEKYENVFGELNYTWVGSEEPIAPVEEEEEEETETLDETEEGEEETTDYGHYFIQFVRYAIGRIDIDKSVIKGDLVPSYVYLSQAKKLYVNMMKTKKLCDKYGYNAKMTNKNNLPKEICCICDKYNAQGGDDMLNLLKGLIDEAETRSENLMLLSYLYRPVLSFPILLTSSSETLGYYSTYENNWDGKIFSNKGEVKTVDNKSYEITESNGGKYDKDNCVIIFDEENAHEVVGSELYRNYNETKECNEDWYTPRADYYEKWFCTDEITSEHYDELTGRWINENKWVNPCDVDTEIRIDDHMTEYEVYHYYLDDYKVIEGTCDSKLQTLRRYTNEMGEKPYENFDWLYFYRKGLVINYEQATDGNGQIAWLNGGTQDEDDNGYVINLMSYGNVITDIIPHIYNRTIVFKYIIGAHLKGKLTDENGVSLTRTYNDFVVDKESKYGKFCGIEYTETYSYSEGDELDKMIASSYTSYEQLWNEFINTETEETIEEYIYSNFLRIFKKDNEEVYLIIDDGFVGETITEEGNLKIGDDEYELFKFIRRDVLEDTVTRDEMIDMSRSIYGEIESAVEEEVVEEGEESDDEKEKKKNLLYNYSVLLKDYIKVFFTLETDDEREEGGRGKWFFKELVKYAESELDWDESDIPTEGEEEGEEFNYGKYFDNIKKTYFPYYVVTNSEEIEEEDGIFIEREIITVKNNFETYVTSNDSGIKHYEFYASDSIDTYSLMTNGGEVEVEYIKADFKYTVDNKVDMLFAPIVKEDYLVGIDYKPEVDNRVFVERGNNYAFEKHIKFGEIKTMEDMLEYQNGSYFNIMEG